MTQTEAYIAAYKEYMENPSRCKKCNSIIEYDGRPLYEMIRRKFCNHSCACSYGNKTRRTLPPPVQGRKCLRCSKVLLDHQETFCSGKCACDTRRDDFISRWKSGEESGASPEGVMSLHVKKYIWAKYENKCNECGWCEKHPVNGRIPVQIHHVNGDWADNTEDNLVLLCPNCHSLTENNGMLNRGKGRIARYTSYRKSIARKIENENDLVLT